MSQCAVEPTSPPPVAGSGARRAPWMANSLSTMCLCCGNEFGMFVNRRHHCRMCGALVCDDCSKHRVSSVPGYEGESVRACNVCFYHDVALLLVYNLMLSGFHHKLFADRAEALKALDDVPKYASRVLMQLGGSGEVLGCYYARDSWQQRITAHAEAQRARYLRPRFPLTWHPNYAAPAPASAPAKPLLPSPPQALLPPPPADDGVAVAMLYRLATSDAVEHNWVFMPGAPASAAVAEAERLLSQLPGLVFGAVLETSGAVHALRASPGLGAPANVLEQSLRAYLGGLGVVVARHEGGEARAVYHPRLAPALAEVTAVPGSLVVVDTAGFLVMSRGCTASWREALARHAGAALLEQQQLRAIAVVSDSGARLVPDMYTARKALFAERGAAIFGVSTGTSVPATVVLLHRGPSVAKEAALALAPAARAVLSTAAPAAAAKQTPAAAAAPAAAVAPECQICFTCFDAERRRPCLCPACGNTLCAVCARSVTACPFCRRESAPGAPLVPNVALLQLISGE